MTFSALFWFVNASGIIGGMLATLWLVTGRKNRPMLLLAFGLSMLFFLARFVAWLLH